MTDQTTQDGEAKQQITKYGYAVLVSFVAAIATNVFIMLSGGQSTVLLAPIAVSVAAIIIAIPWYTGKKNLVMVEQ